MDFNKALAYTANTQSHSLASVCLLGGLHTITSALALVMQASSSPHGIQGGYSPYLSTPVTMARGTLTPFTREK